LVLLDAREALSAVSELRTRLTYALGGDESADPGLAADLIRLYADVLWCRDAALLCAKRGHSWGDLTKATQTVDSTLQSRLERWIKREEGT
jgi:hypothetical protein